MQTLTDVRCKCESFALSLASTVVLLGLNATTRPNFVLTGRTGSKKDTPNFHVDQLRSARSNRIVAGAVMGGMLQSTVRMEGVLAGKQIKGVKGKKTAGG